MAAPGGANLPASSITPAVSSSTKKDYKGKACPPAPKLRVMCLHGFRTSAKVMEKQVEQAEWGPLLHDLVEFVYMDAPHPATGKSDVERNFDPPYFQWYQVNHVRHLSYLHLHS